MEKIKGYRLGLLTVLFPLLCLSCQEVYVNSALDASARIPVIEGRITNSENANYVKAYYARPYTNSKIENITGAIVEISDNNGNSIELMEKSAGYYATERGEFTGVIGRKYKVHVELPDGSVIESIPEIMPDTLNLEKCSFNFDAEKVITRDQNGKIEESSEQGYSYFMTTGNTDKEYSYFKLNSDFYVYSTYIDEVKVRTTYFDEAADTIVNATLTHYLHYDCYELFQDYNLPIIGYCTSGQPLSEQDRKFKTRFFKKDYNYYTNNTFVEYVIDADLYSLNYESYEYYKKLVQQLSAPDRIYDPIPSQLTGNMRSLADSTQTVLGLFEVSSRSRRCNAIYKYVSFGAESLQSRYYPDTSSFKIGCTLKYTTTDTLVEN